MELCTVDGCERPAEVKSRELCKYHHKKWCREHPDLVHRPSPEREVERFWEKVDKGDGSQCWIWNASRSKQGYGRFARNDGQFVQASRFAYEITYRQIPEGMDVLHSCDNQPCVRPDHLFLGTDLDNRRDAIRKGRARLPLPPIGSRNGQATMAEDQVLEARIRYSRGGVSVETLAQAYGVSRQAMDDVITGESWKHVGGPVRGGVDGRKQRWELGVGVR